MGRDVLLLLDANAILRDVLREARAAPVSFVVLRGGDDLFAFRPHELEVTPDLDAPARVSLRLEPWKASVRVIGAQEAAPPLPDPTAPSTYRTIYLSEDGDLLDVDDLRPATLLGGTPGPAEGEGTHVVRFPSIEAEERAGDVRITVDLERDRSPETLADPIQLDDLGETWTQVALGVRVASPQLEFASGAEEGTVRIRRDRNSVPCVLVARRRATGPLEITAMFFREDRWCGTACRTFAAEPRPETGSVAVVPGARAADLTVHIHRVESDPTRLVWTMVPAIAHRALVRRSTAESRLPADAGEYVRGLFRLAEGSRPGAHVAVMNGIGERLWGVTPRELQDAYAAMRRALGTGFSIQFLTDEPHIPWELMRPVVDDEARDLLGVTHPVARGLQAYPDRLRPALPATGEILTIAPDYARSPGRGLPALPGARNESVMLQQRFAAVAIRSTARGLLEAFQDRRGVAVRLVHFAGHGKSEVPVDRSRIACEDDDVSVAQLRNAENRLGENYGTFVVLNACESGAAGDALADVGGWGEAFAYRKFSGMIAPLWAVLDRDATAAMERLFTALLHDRTPVGEALRDMRAELGSLSPTYLSYVYYGDVHARFT